MSFLRKSLLAVLATVAAGNVSAQDLPKNHLKVIGAWGNLSQYKNFERPFWTKQIPTDSKGAITVDITPFNEMGLKGPEIFRLMRLGVIDFGSTVLGYVAGDDPRNEAIDLAGLAADVSTARKVSDAYKPVYDKFYREKFGIQVLGIWPYSAQVLFCKGKIGGLGDLKGKKVRVGNRTLAEFVGALGGTGVTLPFSEVVQAMQTGVVDCAITGTLSGNSAKWYEVADTIYALPLGWSQVMHGVNVKRWEKLDSKTQTFLKSEISKLEDRIWKAAAEETQQGFDCNVGKSNCTMGAKARMTLVPVSEADRALLKKTLDDVVVAKWAARCPGDCVGEWNKTVGKIVGISASAKAAQ